jgi:hypothetical protein
MTSARITRTDTRRVTDDAFCTCSACSRTFRNVAEFDRYRSRGRCRTPDTSSAEMTAAQALPALASLWAKNSPTIPENGSGTT